MAPRNSSASTQQYGGRITSRLSVPVGSLRCNWDASTHCIIPPSTRWLFVVIVATLRIVYVFSLEVT